MSEHQSIYRPIGTALRQEQFFRNGTGRKQPTKTSQILWNKSYSCLYINYEWLFQSWLIGLCMCLQIQFHKRMGADCTNRNSTRNHFFFQPASKASQAVRSFSHCSCPGAAGLVTSAGSPTTVPGPLRSPCGSCLPQAHHDWFSYLPTGPWSPGALMLLLGERSLAAPWRSGLGVAAGGPLAWSLSPEQLQFLHLFFFGCWLCIQRYCPVG